MQITGSNNRIDLFKIPLIRIYPIIYPSLLNVFPYYAILWRIFPLVKIIQAVLWYISTRKGDQDLFIENTFASNKPHDIPISFECLTMLCNFCDGFLGSQGFCKMFRFDSHMIKSSRLSLNTNYDFLILWMYFPYIQPLWRHLQIRFPYLMIL